jgi:hypothetical protein
MPSIWHQRGQLSPTDLGACSFIIDNYFHLPNATLFLHSKRYQWHNDDPDYGKLQSRLTRVVLIVYRWQNDAEKIQSQPPLK